ncbi:probable receptor-like protein kinase At2g23200 [Helianthus annuus]|uniref:probable receptor-like protein kinase At2g23200 n=1 Tax=Helianthus annuus TaxID=4232 RepID=UPI000B8F0C02|nr:probable receptor-like protein kinase At2g23200 [Helianthus annuus]
MARSFSRSQKPRRQVQNLDHLKIALKDIQLATENFDEKYCIGSGGYGKVYKSYLAIKMKGKDELTEMSTVAIKRIFNRDDGQGKEGFLAEIDVLSRCEHPNIISLLGFCVEDNEMLLVYEHAPKKSLDGYLGSTNKVNPTWTQRLQMCIDIAHGLHYLHTNMGNKYGIIHRDIKSDNILLGENWEAKIADFGLSKVHHGYLHASTIKTNHIAGTNVYLDPEYARTGTSPGEASLD